MFIVRSFQRILKMSSLCDLHSMPEIPAIAHFCSLFKSSFDLIDFEIDELENALLRQNPDDVFSSTLVERLVVKLLIGCLPMYASKIHDGNFTTYLRQLIQSKREEAEEDDLEFVFEDPFEANDQDEFCDLSSSDQIKVVYQLTEFRLQCDDVEKKLKDLDPEGLRVNPLGVDSDNVIYWYFFGTRLYKEVKATRKSKPKKKVDGKSNTDDEEAETPIKEAPGWYLACSAQSQWDDLAKRLKKSKKKADKELYETLEENFLPEITKMFTEKEREEKIKLMMLSKRTSSRIERVREQREQEFQRRKEIERQNELERREEQERQRLIEKENKEKNSRENRAKMREQKQLYTFISDQNSREDRAKIRQQKQLYATIINDHDYLLPNRKRVRAGPEDDHMEPGEEEEEVAAKSRRKNPALREFQRLVSSDEQSDAHGRNLRL